jgi:hypothetical protein
MTSPFPGMDPYLEGESIWPVFHRQFVQCLLQALQLGLSDRYAAEAASRAELHEDYIEVRQRSDGWLVTLLDVVSPANKATAAHRPNFFGRGPKVRSRMPQLGGTKKLKGGPRETPSLHGGLGRPFGRSTTPRATARSTCWRRRTGGPTV